MKIKSLRLENFQGIGSAEFDFDGVSASIYGDNATGKTTVFNAVTWLLFDKASTGAKNFTPKTKGASGDLHNLDHAAEATFIMDAGEIATFRKVYHEVWKKKRGSSTEEFDGNTIDFYIDGVPTKEKQYTSTLQNYCGGIERMKMLTMPDYFAEVMPWDARRKILLELCGDVTDEDVIASNSDLAELDTYLKKPGTTSRRYSVEEYKKIAAARKSEINKQLAALPGRIDEARRAIPAQGELITVNQLDSAISECNSTRNSLVEERASLLTGDTAVADAKRKTADAEAAISAARNAYNVKVSEANSQILDEIGRMTAAMSEARSKAVSERANAKQYGNDANRMAEARNRLLQEYSAAAGTVWDEAQETCPTCGQKLPTDRIAEMKADFNKRRSERLMEINQRGKETCSKEAIQQLKDKAAAAEKAAAKAENEAAEFQSGVDALRAELKQAPAFETTQEYTSLFCEVNRCRARERELAESSAPDTSHVDAQISALDAEIDSLRKKKLQFEQSEAQKNRVAELELSEKQMGAEYENLEHGIWLCDEFTKAKVKMLTDRIDSKFKSVRFRLFQEQLNGGVKDDCEVLIPTESGRMVPYTFANNAARINAGLEIISALSEHWNMEMPVFIDNAESVTHLLHTWMQTIRLVVSEQDKQLRLALD